MLNSCYTGNNSRIRKNRVNLSKEFQDYDDNDPDIEFRKNRWNYWQSLKNIRKDFMETRAEFDVYDFRRHVEDIYGIKMFISEGEITDTFIVVDEQKYLIFLMKWK